MQAGVEGLLILSRVSGATNFGATFSSSLESSIVKRASLVVAEGLKNSKHVRRNGAGLRRA